MKKLIMIVGIALSITFAIASENIFDLGDKKAKNNNESAPGEIEAVKKLADEINKNKSADKVKVKWIMIFPSGGKYSNELIYDIAKKTLTYNKVNSGNYVYTEVDPSHIDKLASEEYVVDIGMSHLFKKEGKFTPKK